MPSEHGGWGLTLEPVLLGLLVAWSGAGVALGVAAFTAFLVRTPAKLVAVDRPSRALARSVTPRAADRDRRTGRARSLPSWRRSRWRAGLAGAGRRCRLRWWRWSCRSTSAAAAAGWCPSCVARSLSPRSRRRSCSLLVAAAGLAAGVWLVLAARAVGAIPFVRVQILRLRRGAGPVWQSDVAQGCAVVRRGGGGGRRSAAVGGLVGVVVLAVVQSLWVRRAPIPAKQLGLRQMAMGLALVAVDGCRACCGEPVLVVCRREGDADGEDRCVDDVGRGGGRVPGAGTRVRASRSGLLLRRRPHPWRGVCADRSWIRMRRLPNSRQR